MEDLIDGIMTFEKVTRHIRVAVQSFFLEDQSYPDDQQYVWAYRVRISNEGALPVKLLNRHWVITDAAGYMNEVKGEGVIGEQPNIEPGKYFVYTSGTPLPTPSGFMHGEFEMTIPGGKSFQVEIPAFSLDSPYGNDLLH